MNLTKIESFDYCYNDNGNKLLKQALSTDTILNCCLMPVHQTPHCVWAIDKICAFFLQFGLNIQGPGRFLSDVCTEKGRLIL